MNKIEFLTRLEKAKIRFYGRFLAENYGIYDSGNNIRLASVDHTEVTLTQYGEDRLRQYNPDGTRC